MEEQTPITNNRRAALKALAAATGAATLAAIPARWSKPAVMVGAVPAHAQTSCRYALYFDNFVESSSGDLQGDFLPSPEETDNATYFAWYCGTGCVYLIIGNDSGASGNASFDVTVYGSTFTVVLAPGGEFYLGLNRTTGQWDSGSTVGAVDWDGIGCPLPG